MIYTSNRPWNCEILLIFSFKILQQRFVEYFYAKLYDHMLLHLAVIVIAFVTASFTEVFLYYVLCHMAQK